ncbi:MAG: aldose 1-epimerase, partial [Actinomycetes bacterium]
SGARAPLGDRAFDDLFDELSQPPSFTLSGPGREIELEFEGGYHFTQVYAPPDQPFICFEPMTAPTNALISGDRLSSVAPGEQFTAAFKITVGI